MLTRRDILSIAANDCMRELYTLVQPAVEWDDFISQCNDYTSKYKEWEKNRINHPEWKDKHINDCIGPKPYEFYYLPKEILKDVVDNYIYAYRIDKQQDLLDIIETLKNYCEAPVVDKYIEDYTDENGVHHPGHRSYAQPNDIIEELCNTITSGCGGNDFHINIETLAQQCWDKVKEFLDMAGNFYSWNHDLNSFNMTIYLGASPNSNKEAVIENWKKYRGEDIEIDESKWSNDEDF